MTTYNAAPAIPASGAIHEVVASKLRLQWLSGIDNPLPNGGMLRTCSTHGDTFMPLAPGVTSSDTPFVGLGVAPRMVYILETPSGIRVLRLEFEVTDLGELPQDRLAVQVTAIGIAPEQRGDFLIDPALYTWKLAARAVGVDTAMQLEFDLVQEAEPTEHFDTQASCRLALLGDGGGIQRAIILPRPSGVGAVGLK